MNAGVESLIAVRLVTRKSEHLAAFYADAFGFKVGLDGDDDLGEGRVRRLQLGDQEIELLTPHVSGLIYPHAAGAADTIFQHVALVVPDMTAAMSRLGSVSGWSAISMRGPEHLPVSSGDVIAFKFRDPEGHPLELLQFPSDAVPPAWQRSSDKVCLGYDHSAITVSDTASSLSFYAHLSLTLGGKSINLGDEQSRLDAEPGAVVTVTGLRVPRAPPHVELLCYRRTTARTPAADNDVAATQLVFGVNNAEALDSIRARHPDCIVVKRGTDLHALRLSDPDGHRLWLVIQTH